MLRDLADKWATIHIPDPVVRKDFLRSFDAAVRKKIDFYLLIGSKLMRQPTARLVHCFANELFIFSLSRGQAISFGVKPAWMSCTEGNPCQLPDPGGPTLLTLYNVRLAGGTTLQGCDPVVGSCQYSASGNVSLPYALEMEYAIHGKARVKCWFYPTCRLQAEGGFSFSFAPIKRPDQDYPWRGATTLFFRVFHVPNSRTDEGRQPVSNACAALVDVV